MIKKATPLLLFLALLPAALLVWWPLWFLLAGSLTAQSELLSTIGPALGAGGSGATWQFLPNQPTLANLIELLLDTPQFFVMFWNTAGQVFPQVAGQLLAGAPAAWALSRLRFRGRGAVRVLYIVLMLLPFQVTMVPSYLVLSRLSLLDTPWAVILPGVFATFPVFIMMRGFDAVPRPLLEAAAIDGAGQLQTFFHIGLPLGLPGILAALTLNFLDGWNAIEQPMTFLKNQALWPLSLYLSSVNIQKLGVAMAASLAMLLPAALIFRFGQPYLELGLAEIGGGAVKE